MNRRDNRTHLLRPALSADPVDGIRRYPPSALVRVDGG
jgi:hypothetical protein